MAESQQEEAPTEAVPSQARPVHGGYASLDQEESRADYVQIGADGAISDRRYTWQQLCTFATLLALLFTALSLLVVYELGGFRQTVQQVDTTTTIAGTTTTSNTLNYEPGPYGKQCNVNQCGNCDLTGKWNGWFNGVATENILVQQKSHTPPSQWQPCEPDKTECPRQGVIQAVKQARSGYSAMFELELNEENLQSSTGSRVGKAILGTGWLMNEQTEEIHSATWHANIGSCDPRMCNNICSLVVKATSVDGQLKGQLTLIREEFLDISDVGDAFNDVTFPTSSTTKPTTTTTNVTASGYHYVDGSYAHKKCNMNECQNCDLTGDWEAQFESETVPVHLNQTSQSNTWQVCDDEEEEGCPRNGNISITIEQDGNLKGKPFFSLWFIKEIHLPGASPHTDQSLCSQGSNLCGEGWVQHPEICNNTRLDVGFQAPLGNCDDKTGVKYGLQHYCFSTCHSLSVRPKQSCGDTGSAFFTLRRKPNEATA